MSVFQQAWLRIALAVLLTLMFTACEADEDDSSDEPETPAPFVSDPSFWVDIQAPEQDTVLRHGDTINLQVSAGADRSLKRIEIFAIGDLTTFPLLIGYEIFELEEKLKKTTVEMNMVIPNLRNFWSMRLVVLAYDEDSRRTSSFITVSLDSPSE